jgi:hypothetical protein
MDRVLIHIPAEIHGGRGSPNDLTDIEEQDKAMVEKWKDEVDTVLVFVCAGSTILGIFPSKEYVPRLVSSRLSAWSHLLKRTSGYLPIQATRPSIYSMRLSI